MYVSGFFEPDSPHNCNYVLTNIWIWKCCWHCCQPLHVSSLLSSSIIKFSHKDMWEIYNLTNESTCKIWEQAICQNRHWLQSSHASNLRRINYKCYLKYCWVFSFQNCSEEKNIQLCLLLITTKIWIASQRHFRGQFCVSTTQRSWVLLFWSLYTISQLSKRMSSQCLQTVNGWRQMVSQKG